MTTIETERSDQFYKIFMSSIILIAQLRSYSLWYLDYTYIKQSRGLGIFYLGDDQFPQVVFNGVAFIATVSCVLLL